MGATGPVARDLARGGENAPGFVPINRSVAPTSTSTVDSCQRGLSAPLLQASCVPTRARTILEQLDDINAYVRADTAKLRADTSLLRCAQKVK